MTHLILIFMLTLPLLFAAAVFARVALEQMHSDSEGRFTAK